MPWRRQASPCIDRHRQVLPGIARDCQILRSAPPSLLSTQLPPSLQLVHSCGLNVKEPGSVQIDLRFQISVVGVDQNHYQLDTDFPKTAIWWICDVVRIGRVPNQVLVSLAGLKRKELFRGVVTCFGL